MSLRGAYSMWKNSLTRFSGNIASASLELRVLPLVTLKGEKQPPKRVNPSAALQLVNSTRQQTRRKGRRLK